MFEVFLRSICGRYFSEIYAGVFLGVRVVLYTVVSLFVLIAADNFNLESDLLKYANNR